MKKNRESWLVFLVVIGLVIGTAGYLGSLQARQGLGGAGLRILNQPLYDEQGKLIQASQVYLPASVLAYQSTNLPVTALELGYLPEDTTYGRRRYIGTNGFTVDVSVVLMGADRSSIHKPEICLDGQGWTIDRSELVTIPMSRPYPYDLPVMKLTASKPWRSPAGTVVPRRAVFLYWFVAENRLTAQHAQRMWWTLKDLARTGALPRWAYVSFLSFCPPGYEEAVFRHMTELVTAAVPEFQLVPGPVEPADHARR